MHWLNEPPAWRAEGGSIHVTAAPGSDFWQKTHYGFQRDNGHFYYNEVSGDFTLAAEVRGGYRDLYDQAGLMLRIDAANWIKTGIEFVHGRQFVSAVVTRDVSDWSVLPLSGSPPAIWMRLKRAGDTVEIHYSLDGQEYTMLRLAYFPPGVPVQAGLMCAAPDGQGFPVEFRDLRLEQMQVKSEQ